MISGGEQSHGSSVMDQVGDNIIHHVSNSDIHHPIVHLPHLFGIDMSVTKHVMMLWVVAVLVSVVVIIPIRRFLRKGSGVPTGMINAIESIVKFIRDSIVKPNVGSKWVMMWTPLLLTFFFFILFANAIGMIPIFDILGLSDRFVLVSHSSLIVTILSMVYFMAVLLLQVILMLPPGWQPLHFSQSWWREPWRMDLLIIGKT
jgi:F0F1-type ATP synthase membrane subunit a